jgi:SP family facilitated glucose transporter-like MFS transporter 1
VGTVYQLVVTISILVSQILGMESLLGTPTLWPILLGLTLVPAIYQLIALPFCPESPKYTLLNKGKEIEAQRGQYSNEVNQLDSQTAIPLFRMLKAPFTII